MNEKLQDLFNEWRRLQPLRTEDQKRLWDKLRLEWNYNSNHIEGNTLSYGETELLLVHGQTTGTHAIREYEEMKAHDVAIAHIERMAESPDLITEGDIRDLNKLILKEPYWKSALAEGGQPTRTQVIPGEYKSAPNSVRTATDEIFHFSPPNEVHDKVREIVTRIRSELQTPTQDSITLAADVHHRFVFVHPFDDGNGRVARLIANYILLKSGFPPVVVKSSEKAAYLAALRLADSGEPQSLANYFENLMEWSLGLGIRAARGESIEESNDTEKEIKLFIQRQDRTGPSVLIKSADSLNTLWKNGLQNLTGKFIEKLRLLEPLFAETSISVQITAGGVGRTYKNWQQDIPQSFKVKPSPTAVVLKFQLRGYNAPAVQPFNFDIMLTTNFEEFRCNVMSSMAAAPISKLYSEVILSDEIEAFITASLKNAFTQVKATASSK